MSPSYLQVFVFDLKSPHLKKNISGKAINEVTEIQSLLEHGMLLHLQKNLGKNSGEKPG